MKVMSVSSDDSVRDAGDPDRADSSRLIVTIDGPAGTGKSSVARMVATRVGLTVLDTGAMYRAAALLTPSSEDRSEGRCPDRRGHRRPPHRDGLRRRARERPVGRRRSRRRDSGKRSRVDRFRGGRASRGSAATGGRSARDRNVALQAGHRRPGSGFCGLPGRGCEVLPHRFEWRPREETRQSASGDGSGGRSGVGASGDRGAGPHRCRSRRRPLIRPQGAIEIETDSLTLAEVVDRLVEIVKIVEAARDSGGGS